jgi:hypothetical protein
MALNKFMFTGESHPSFPDDDDLFVMKTYHVDNPRRLMEWANSRPFALTNCLPSVMRALGEINEQTFQFLSSQFGTRPSGVSMEEFRQSFSGKYDMALELNLISTNDRDYLEFNTFFEKRLKPSMCVICAYGRADGTGHVVLIGRDQNGEEYLYDAQKSILITGIPGIIEKFTAERVVEIYFLFGKKRQRKTDELAAVLEDDDFLPSKKSRTAGGKFRRYKRKNKTKKTKKTGRRKSRRQC